MLKRLFAFALATALSVASAGVLAQSHGGHGGGGWHGGGGGNWHGGGGNWHGGGGNWNGGNWHGGNWHGGNWNGGSWHGSHGHWHNGRFISFAVGAPLFWGWPYYYPYYYDPYYPTYSYYPAPNAVYLDEPSGQAQPYQPQTRSAPNAQYYCPDTGYYPQVQSCPKGWLRVVPDSPPAQ